MEDILHATPCPATPCPACPKRGGGTWDVLPGSGWWWLEMLPDSSATRKSADDSLCRGGCVVTLLSVPLTVPFFCILYYSILYCTIVFFYIDHYYNIVLYWQCNLFVVPSSHWLGWRALAQQQGRLGDWRTLGLSDPHLLIMAMVPRFRLMVYQLWEFRGFFMAGAPAQRYVFWLFCWSVSDVEPWCKHNPNRWLLVVGVVFLDASSLF